MGIKIWEREPKRQIEIQDPSRYKGQLGASNTPNWFTTDRVFVVNGYINKADGNFLVPFEVFPLPKIFIAIGGYVATDNDIMRIAEKQCTAVLDIQTPNQHRMRETNFDRLQKMFINRSNITNVVNYPVDDVFLDDYVEALIGAAKQLDKMINEQGEEVFVNCTTGISRAPTLILVYLSIYCRHKQWNNLDALANYLKDAFPNSQPNLMAVKLCIERCKSLQAQNKIRFEKDQKNKKAAKEEAERRKQLKIAQDEAERLRLKRLAEQEAENIRRQRLEYEQKERDLRAQGLAEEDALKEKLRKARENYERDLALRDAEEAERQRKLRAASEEAFRKAEADRKQLDAEILAERTRLQKLIAEAGKEEQKVKKEKL